MGLTPPRSLTPVSSPYRARKREALSETSFIAGPKTEMTKSSLVLSSSDRSCLLT